jgi:hypothetical protein
MTSRYPLQFNPLPFTGTLLILLLATFALATALDPYLDFTSPIMTQLANAALPMGLAVLLWRLTGRVVTVIALVGLAHTLVIMINTIKTDLLGVNLIWADLRMVHSVAQAPQLIFGFVDVPGNTAWQLAAWLALAIGGWFFLRDRQRSLSARVGQSVLPAALLVTWPYVDVSEQAVNRLHWDMFNQVRNAKQTGVLGNIVLGGLATGNPLFPAQHQTIDEFWNAPEILKAMAGPYSRYRKRERPDIIVILSESLFEPSLLCGMRDQPVLKNLARMLPAKQDGLEVPVFGNRTLQSEFEVLSGTPLKHFPKSVFSYYDLLKHPIDALPRTLKDMGYATHALHPNYSSYWNRHTVYPQMGIDYFHQVTSFVKPDDYSTPWHVSDQRLMEVATRLLRDDQDSFLFIATIANHGPWNFEPKKPFPVPADLLDDKVRDSLRDYIGRAIDADEAIAWLTRYLAKRKKPTLVVVFGDHMPALGKVYEQVCFKNGLPAEAQKTTVKFWANYPLDKRDIPQQTASFLLPGHAVRLAGLPVEGYMLANAMLGKAELEHKADLAALREAYSHLAAENLAQMRRVMLPAKQFLDSTAATTLENFVEMSAEVRPVSRELSEFILAAEPAASTELSFNLQGQFNNLTLRPYVWPLQDESGNPVCTNAQLKQPWQLQVQLGERQVLSRKFVPRDVELLQLNLEGESALKFSWQAPKSAAQCSELRVRVTHLVCAGPSCQ